MRASGHVRGKAIEPLATGEEGEAVLAKLVGAKFNGTETQVVASTGACAEMCNSVARRFDVFVDNVAYESKVGRVYLSPSIERQIRSDAFLIKTGQIEGARWDFFTSSVSGTIGPSQPVVDLLNELQIPYSIHLPNK